MAKDLESKLYEVLQTQFKIEEFRPSQKEIILSLLAGENNLVLMPTGSGKSLCYQLPAVLLPGLTIVISPLIALMKDQVDSLVKRGFKATYVNSSLNKTQRIKRYAEISQNKYKIIFVAPERFRKKEFLSALENIEVSLLAVDEAHCISQWGSDFRPDYSKVGIFWQYLGKPPVIALTATATQIVQQDIVKVLGLTSEEINIHNLGIHRPNLFLKVDEVIDETEKFEKIYQLVKKNSGGVIVYFTLIKNLERFSHYLGEKKIPHQCYHGKLNTRERQKTQQFFNERDNCLMLATNSFGMGIDKPNIRLIVHADIPDSLEAYYQEIGRAGRDGKDSQCVLFFGQDDLAVQMQFLEWKNPDSKFIKKCYEHLLVLGQRVNSFSYEELQEQLVYKDRGDQRLQTVLNLFDLYGVTKGSLEKNNLSLKTELVSSLISEEKIQKKLELDRNRLIEMVKYVRTDDNKQVYLNEYFT